MKVKGKKKRAIPKEKCVKCGDRFRGDKMHVTTDGRFVYDGCADAEG